MSEGTRSGCRPVQGGGTLLRKLLLRARRRWLVPLAVLLGVAAVPRFATLGHPSLTSDEYYDYQDSLRFCREGSLLEPISDGGLNGQLPFFLACPAYRTFGANEVVARAISAVVGVGVVAATFVVGRCLLGVRWSLVASLLVALSSYAVSSSRLAFSHGHVSQVPLVLLGLAAVLRATPASHRRLLRGSAWAGLSLGIACGCDLLASFWTATAVLLLLWRMRRLAAGRALPVLLLFALAWALGLGCASPMYFAHPLAMAADVAARVTFWDSQRGFIWAGREVETVPVWYYPVVLAVKIAAPVLVASCAGLLLNLGRHARAGVWVSCLWPLLPLSIKPWKSPFYIAAFLPLFYLLAADALRRAWRWPGLGRRPWAGAVVLSCVFGSEAALLVRMHPDHLMVGIHYGDRFFGEFSGPAVSHGQWTGEALEYIRDRCGPRQPVILIYEKWGPRQVEMYAERLGLRRLYRGYDLPRRGVDELTHLVVNQDSYREWLWRGRAKGQNSLLNRLARESGRFRLVKTFSSGTFPMVWVYERVGTDGCRSGTEEGQRPP